MEGQEPAGTDPIDMHLPRGAAGSSRMPTTEQTTPQSTAPVTRLIDTKSLLQVTPYHGDKASLLGWKWSFLIAVRASCKPLYEELKKIEDNMNQDFRKSRMSNEDLELSDPSYTLSVFLCKDEACACVRSAEDGNSSQAWQALLRARTARIATNLLNQLLEPTFTSSDPRINLRQWNKNAEECATRTGERVSDGIRRVVYMNQIAPQDMRQHLMNQSRLSTAEKVAQEIEDYWDATQEFSGNDKGRAVFITPVAEGPAKGGKPDGVPHSYRKEWLEGQRKNAQKDSYFNPSVVSTDVLLDTAIGAGESATRSRSVGFNKRTQRAIHRRTRCKETFVNGRTQRRKGKVTTSPKVEVNERKCKRKQSGKENRKPRTRRDLPVKKLDSARWVFFFLVSNARDFNLSVMFKKMMILRHPEWIEQLVCLAFKSARVS